LKLSSRNVPARRPRSAEQGLGPERAATTLRGSLAVVSPLDLLAWLCGNKRDWSIRLHGQGVDALVTVRDGQIVDARWAHIHGLEALGEIVGCQRGFFELVPVTGSQQRTLHGHWQGLLHSALQALHERNREEGEEQTQIEMRTPEMLASGLAPPT
jgi:Domain of unknown function (DUF4388)